MKIENIAGISTTNQKPKFLRAGSLPIRNSSPLLRRIVLFSLINLLFFYGLHAKEPGVMIGAQVYIEPGQSPDEIEHYFSLLKDNNMKVCRIRMDETHMRLADGTYDFSLYQKAFDEAAKNGIKVFATLFPGYPLHLQDEYGGVGGFKFPVSGEHLNSIAHYIDVLVNHFKDHQALHVWVLQNEPGVAGNLPANDFAREKYGEWLSEKPKTGSYNDYLQVQHNVEWFMRDYTTWYLGWIAQQIRQYDSATELHVNPHMIFRNLADYDFTSWKSFLSHIGASMHPSWHFGYFERNEFPLAMAANGEIMRTGSAPNPWWVTELQGGYNSFSAYNPLKPTKQEIAQWMWTNIARGADGIIFWTLNPRATGLEAGEWALIDFHKNASDRLQMAGRIAGILNDHTDLRKPKPVLSDVYLLYSPESILFQRKTEMHSDEIKFQYTARTESAHVKEMLAFFRSLEGNGYGAQIWHMDQFNWDEDPTGKTVILANMAVVPRQFYPKLSSFVEEGGQLIVSGITAHFDEYGYNVMYGKWPLANLFGATIRDFNTMPNKFGFTVNGFKLGGHFLQGVIENTTATVLGFNDYNEPIATVNTYGKGQVVWLPTITGIAEWENPNPLFTDFLKEYIKPGTTQQLLQPSVVKPGITIAHFDGQNHHYSLIINKSGESALINTTGTAENTEIIFNLGSPTWNSDGLQVENEECMVLKWK